MFQPVFLSARRDRISDVQWLFEQSGISYRTSDDFTGAPALQLHEVLSNCGALVAFITSMRPPCGMILEIGAGLGIGIPVVLIVHSKVRLSGLPAALRELPAMRLPEKGSNEGVFRLQSLLESSSEFFSPRPQASLPNAEASHREWADESERLAGEALQRLGARIVSYEPPNRRGRPDLAVWWPQFLGPPYNPMLVEVAERNADIREKESQLRGYMSQADALVGLLAVHTSAGANWRVQPTGAVLVVDLGYLRTISRSSFEDLLQVGRNRLFHAS